MEKENVKSLIFKKNLYFHFAAEQCRPMLRQCCLNPNKIESKNDAIQISVRQKIIKIENDMQPVEVMFIYEIIKRIGQLADCAQQVGMQLIVVAAR